MIKLWAEILNAGGTVLPDGPIDLSSASVARGIDAASSIRFSCPVDERARQSVRAGRYMQIFYEDDDHNVILMGEGIIANAGVQGARLTADGKNLLEELTYTLTMPNQTLDAIVGTAISSLIFASGWTVLASGDALSDTVSELFDEPRSLLNAILTVAEHSGTHIRLSTISRRVIEVGNFGEDSELILVDVNADTNDSDSVGILESLNISEQAGQLANWIIPVGADGLTIADSTRPEKQSLLGPDGSLVYYVADQASINEYGMRQIYETFPDLKPRSGSAADIIAAANQIVAAAVATLERRKEIRYDYRGKVRGLRTPLKPGDTVRVIYNEPIFMDDGLVWPGGALDAQLYIIQAETASDGVTIWQTVQLSNVNALKEDIVTEIVKAVERSKKVS